MVSCGGPPLSCDVIHGRYWMAFADRPTSMCLLILMVSLCLLSVSVTMLLLPGDAVGSVGSSVVCGVLQVELCCECFTGPRSYCLS